LVTVDATTGAFRAESAKPTPMAIVVASRNGIRYLSSVDAAQRSSLIAIDGSTGEARSGGPYPAILSTASPLVGQYFSLAAVAAPRPDSLLAVLQSADFIFFGPFPSGPFDSIAIPAIRRRGAMPDLLRAIDARDPSTGERALYKPSYPVGVFPLSRDGLVAVTYSDWELVSGRVTGRLTLSVVDLRERRSCVDAEVPVPPDPMPHATFVADTLVVISSADVGAAGTATTIRKFTVSVDYCEWHAGR